MKSFRWLTLIVIVSMLGACSQGTNGNGGFSLFPSETPLPTAKVNITPAPDASTTVTAYLDALKNNDYAGMYTLLTQVSREAISQEDFAKRHSDALNNMSASSFDYQVLAEQKSPQTAEAAYSITYHTALVGDLQREIVMRMILEDGAWKIQWEEGLILPELAGGNSLRMDYQVPARGDIYDNEGLPLVSQSEIYAFGVNTGDINFDTINTLVADLARLCGLYEEDISDQIAASGPGWYLPMCEGSREEGQRLLSLNLGGLSVSPYNSRYYFGQGFGAHVTGYTQPIQPEQLDEYRRLGYRGDEKIGQTGIEKWAEDYLAGKHGGSLYVVDVNGQIVTSLGESAPEPADSVYLTIDRNLQFYAQKALAGFRGAAVVIERDSGRVLAMASSPAYDPNLFDPGNPNRDLLSQMLNSPNEPLLNRAAQGQFPLGSVFKMITFSAGLESGLFIPETTYDCQYDWTRLPDQVRHDWTWQHCQDRVRAGQFCNTSDSLPSGLLTYSEGLMRSCNPYFWEIGLTLYQHDRANDIAAMARSFGLGASTGIGQVAEAPGQILDPASDVDLVNQAIGQGDVLVTPLQVAMMTAAVGNGGTLYRPQLVERIQPIEGDPVLVFKPEARGTLPLNDANLQLLQDAMWEVVHNTRGTANFRLRGLSIPAAGKTGTAESGRQSGVPHAWFAGYTTAGESTNLPDIAIAVVIEEEGEGSDYAAPIFKAIIEAYYYGQPQSIPWFGPIGGPQYTPTPFGGIPTRTPRP
jgi:cell division protein FtsI/penicillin-binding protein 2